MKILILLMIIFSCNSCSEARKKDPLLSPCVGKNGSPCEKFPVNTWMYKINQ